MSPGVFLPTSGNDELEILESFSVSIAQKEMVVK